MKQFETPQIEVQAFAVEDIVTTSNFCQYETEMDV